MKKRLLIYILFLNVVLCYFAACKKNSQSPSQDIQPTSIVGTWNWAVTYSDDPNFIQTPENTDSSETMILYADKTWKTVTKNTVDSGTYTIGHIQSYGGVIYYSYDTVAFYRGSEELYWSPYEVRNDSLIMNSGLAGLIGEGSTIWVRE
jgi:hypothetical protein